MSTLPRLPELQIQQPANPLAEMGKIVSLRNLSQQGQEEQLKLQEQQLALQDRQKFIQASQMANGDPDKTLQLFVQSGGSPVAAQNYKKGLDADKKSALEMSDAKRKQALEQADLLQGAHDQISQLQTPEQKAAAYQQIIPQLGQAGIDVSKFPQQYPGDEAFANVGLGIKAHTSILAEADKERTLNASEWKVVGDKLINTRTGETKGEALPVDQLNQALTSRWQVMHPGAPLPMPFTLQPNASKDDFNRIDKILEASERQQGTKAQQDTANSIRQQTLALTQQKADLTPVVGTDPKTGRDVLVSMDEGQKMGLTGTMKADAQDVSKAQSARHWIPLASQKGDTPESMGILQLIDKLDKEGKLGPVASRWNDFIAGKVGVGDPDYTALRTKMGLSSTLLMNAHVGSRGGSYMLEHFEDLANAGKMDAQTLRTGVKSELDYIKSRAMLPADREKQLTGESGNSAPSSGKSVSLAAAKQLPINKGKTDEQIKADIVAHGHSVAP